MGNNSQFSLINISMLDNINSKINMSMLNGINISGGPNKRYEWSYSKTKPRPPSLDLTFIQLITKLKLDSKFDIYEGKTRKAASEQHVFFFLQFCDVAQVTIIHNYM
jgi:hypothetical protein